MIRMVYISVSNNTAVDEIIDYIYKKKKNFYKKKKKNKKKTNNHEVREIKKR